MYSDDPHQPSNQRRLIAAIERLPRWDSQENSFEKVPSREESLIVQPEDLFSRNNRERELYCEQESDLRTLGDWIRLEDDHTCTGGFGQSDATDWSDYRRQDFDRVKSKEHYV